MSAPTVEHVDPQLLKSHPKNYKRHPDEQLDHIAKSIEEHGFYRNVVVARDYTILAGHGVVQAVRRMGMFGPATVPVIRLDVDPLDPRALKVLTGDNELGKLAEQDDRLLTEILKDVFDGADLLGTGFDPQSLAALVMVSRPVEEVRDKNEAAEWVGMPEYDAGGDLFKLNVNFTSAADRDAFVEKFGINVRKKFDTGSWSAWWPDRERMDVGSVLFADADGHKQ